MANDDAYDLGQGAGFYVDATQKPWEPHFNMWTYVAQELPKLVMAEFAVLEEKQGITGHSMGGHGALTLAITLPEQFKSVSAFAPIANPCASDWGRKQLGAYLGTDETTWTAHDASLLMAELGFHNPVLIDQGTADNFYDLLRPQAMADAITARKQAATLRMQSGYDHSYFFIQSFMEDHVKFHAELLK
ncbi:MAG: prolyl oligopeptidase family serine peptidase [Amylibacter sp.]|nr:prolyl oligopeptidase family serine peptidase [Amylibacter sp.]